MSESGALPLPYPSTHIAAPSRHVVGGFSPYTARGVSLLMEHGPWAARRYAASLYAQGRGYPPSA